jgi:hypothetical protein
VGIVISTHLPPPDELIRRLDAMETPRDMTGPGSSGVSSWGDTLHSTVAYLQADAYFAGFTVGEVNAGLFKGFLYLEHGGEVS